MVEIVTIIMVRQKNILLEILATTASENIFRIIC
jgi:hypothetical protein